MRCLSGKYFEETDSFLEEYRKSLFHLLLMVYNKTGATPNPASENDTEYDMFNVLDEYRIMWE